MRNRGEGGMRGRQEARRREARTRGSTRNQRVVLFLPRTALWAGGCPPTAGG